MKLTFVFTRCLVFSFVFYCSLVSAQNDINRLMTRSKPNCYDIALNAYELLPHYHGNQQIDSVNAVLDFWENKCGLSEELLRFNILLAIEQQSNYLDSVVNLNILPELMDYKNFRSYISANDHHLSLRFQDQNISEYIKYTSYTSGWASRLLKVEKQYSQVELFFLQIYSHDFDNTFQMLEDSAFDGTFIQRQYRIKVAEAKINHWFRGDISLGGWFPTQNLTALGNHAGFGIRGGVQYTRWHALISIKAYLGNSSSSRHVFHDDSLYNSDLYNHVSLAADLGYALFNKQQHVFELIGGIGYNGVKVLEVPNPLDADNPESIYRNSLLLNIGLGYRYDFPTGTYFSLSAKLNFSEFENRPGTDLSGNFFTIDVALGMISQDQQRRNRLLLDID